MNTSRWTILGSLSLVAALAMGAVGCAQDGSPATAEGTTESTAQPVTGSTAKADTTSADATKEGRDHRGGGFRRHGPPGPDGLLFAAMHELTLSDAQRTAIQGAIDSMKPSDSERPARDAAGFKALAASVRSGKVDVSARPALQRDESREAAHRTKLAAALTTLHDTLTAEQRQTLVASVQKKMAEHGARPEAPDAGDKVADKGAHGGRGGKHGHGGDRMGHGGPGVFGMLRDLDLTDTQKDSIKKALDTQREASRPATGDREAHKAQFETMRAEMKARLATFTADRFDATAFVTPPAGAAAPKIDRGNPLASELSIVVPLLTDAQRAKLADRLEQPPTFEHRGER